MALLQKTFNVLISSADYIWLIHLINYLRPSVAEWYVQLGNTELFCPSREICMHLIVFKFIKECITFIAKCLMLVFKFWCLWLSKRKMFPKKCQLSLSQVWIQCKWRHQTQKCFFWQTANFEIALCVVWWQLFVLSQRRKMWCNCNGLYVLAAE